VPLELSYLMYSNNCSTFVDVSSIHSVVLVAQHRHMLLLLSLLLMLELLLLPLQLRSQVLILMFLL
jgi:hypothetical protein